MPLILPGNVGSATAATGYDVANSLRFNDDSTDYLSRTPGSDGNRKTWTFSTWIKRGNIGIGNPINVFGGEDGASRYSDIMIGTPSGADDTFWFKQDTGTVAELRSTMKLRDTAAWYHLVFTYDSTDGTAADRMKMYVNGVRLTSFVTDTNAGENVDSYVNTSGDPNYIGIYQASSKKLDAYLCETVLIDGTALAADSFGEFDSDSGIWKPIDVSGLTFGNNGFYLEFKESGTGTNASGMGADTSGNTNHFAVNNLTAIDQSTDTCTNNFATLNPLDNAVSQAVFTEGNLKSTMNNSNSQGVGSTGTFWVSSGKWYVEAKLINNAGDNGSAFGVTGKVGLSTASADRVGNSADAITYTDTGQKAIAGSYTNSYGSSFTNGDIIGIYIDLDNLKIYFAKNGSLQNSGTGLTLNAIANTLNGVYTFSVGMNAGTGTPVFEINFGGTQTYSISSAVTDDNGYGNFEYSPNITGDSVAKKFYSMCTKNLAEYG